MRLSAAAILALICTLASTSCARSSRDARRQSPVRSDSQLTVQRFERIPGTANFMARIDERQAERYGGSFSGGDGVVTRNLMFLDGTTLDSHRLFPSNSGLVLGTTELPEAAPEDSAHRPEPARPTRWLLHDVVPRDSNGDGRLDSSDERTIGVTDAGGSAYTQFLDRITSIDAMSMLDDTTLLLVYVREGVRTAARIDLQAAAIRSSHRVADVAPGSGSPAAH
jgi:hypothetical protein